MKLVKISGLFLFFSGFILFNILFFLGENKIEDRLLKENMSEEKAGMIKSVLPGLTGKVYSSQFNLIGDIDKAVEKVNQQVTDIYGIGDEEIAQIVELNAGKAFSLASLSSVFSESDDGKVKHKLFKEYGSWLDGREFSAPTDLEKAVDNVVENIENYGIISTYGFDKYEGKSVKYRLTKASSRGMVKENTWMFIFLTFGLWIIGGILFNLPKIKSLPGIKNDHIFHRALINGSWLGVITGSYLIVFYVLLYYFHEYMTTWIVLVDPISNMLSGNEAGQFFLYGFIYTLAILVMGVRMLIKYRHSKYQIFRTISVMFFQLAFAFLIPEILVRLNQPYFDFKNIWPLDYDFFFGSEIDKLVSSGGLGIFMMVWGIILTAIAVPVLVYFYGKRWYCSWVCGCGGLAETAGDPYRQLSNKSLKAWKIERWMVHSVLVFAVLMTAGVLYSYFTGESSVLGMSTYKIRETYGAWIGAGFAGVVGTGFYPFMGNRVWCRFGCPLAAYLGLVQRFKSRFRITTNGGQCISCGNCSTYCEMGIDVRWYAQRGQNIVRSSCVGCGICSSVCPRGVLNLENKDEKGRFGEVTIS